jgi:hypothetical protein
MRRLSCVTSIHKKDNVKTNCTVASKMRLIIRNGLMELSSDKHTLPECTYFTHSHPNMFEDFLYEIHTDFPELVKEKALFMKKIEESYDAFTQSQWTSRLTAVAPPPLGS